EHFEMLGHVVSWNTEVQHLVRRAEVSAQEIGKAFGLGDALAPGDRITDDHDPVAVGTLGRNLRVTKSQSVHPDGQASPCEVTSTVGARADVAKDISRHQLG